MGIVAVLILLALIAAFLTIERSMPKRDHTQEEQAPSFWKRPELAPKEPPPPPPNPNGSLAFFIMHSMPADCEQIWIMPAHVTYVDRYQATQELALSHYGYAPIDTPEMEIIATQLHNKLGYGFDMQFFFDDPDDLHCCVFRTGSV